MDPTRPTRLWGQKRLPWPSLPASEVSRCKSTAAGPQAPSQRARFQPHRPQKRRSLFGSAAASPRPLPGGVLFPLSLVPRPQLGPQPARLQHVGNRSHGILDETYCSTFAARLRPLQTAISGTSARVAVRIGRHPRGTWRANHPRIGDGTKPQYLAHKPGDSIVQPVHSTPG